MAEKAAAEQTRLMDDLTIAILDTPRKGGGPGVMFQLKIADGRSAEIPSP